jgi:Na+/H+ antiporter NhaD/arsenite permease-like protein
MLMGILILLIVFISFIVLLAINKIDRTLVALGCGIISYLVLLFFENAQFGVLAEFIVGTSENGYVNLHSLLLILGIMIIVAISVEGGLFQFLSFRLVQMTKGKPVYLMIVFSILAFCITAIINDILTVILLIPLTISVCRILDIKPAIYIIFEAIMIKLGATLLLISSIPNILIATYLDLSFLAFFQDIGWYTIITFSLTLFVFIALYRDQLAHPREGLEELLDFNVWTFITNRPLMLKSSFVLISVILGFILIPSEILSPDIIAITGAVILLLISKMNMSEIFKKIDFKLILYLIGIFIIVGSMEYVGIIDILGNSIKDASPNNAYVTFLSVLWLSAFFSAMIDNITVARVLIPTVGFLTTSLVPIDKTLVYGGMVYGINWGDNLTPFGDTLILLNVAEQNKTKISMLEIFKMSFPLTIFQLSMISIFFGLFTLPSVFVWILIGTLVPIAIIALTSHKNPKKRKFDPLWKRYNIKSLIKR